MNSKYLSPSNSFYFLDNHFFSPNNASTKKTSTPQINYVPFHLKCASKRRNLSLYSTCDAETRHESTLSNISIDQANKIKKKLKPIVKFNMDIENNNQITEMSKKRLLGNDETTKEKNLPLTIFGQNGNESCSFSTQYTIKSPKVIIKNSIPLNECEKIKCKDFKQLHFLSKMIQDSVNKNPDNPSFEKCKACCEILHIISNNEGKHKKEMQIIHNELFQSIFCTSEHILQRIEVHIPETLKNKKKVRSLSIDHPYPYFKIIKKILDSMDNLINQCASSVTARNLEYTLLKQDYTEMEKHYLKQIQENLVKYNDQKVYYEKVVEDIKNELSKKTKVNERLEQEHQIKIENLEDQKKQIEETVTEYFTEITNLKKQISILEENIKNIGNENICLKYKLQQTIDSYQNTQAIVKNNKLNEQELKDKLKNLEQEIHNLKSNDCENLTPRPNIKPILNFFKVENQNNTTIAQVNTVCKKIQELKELYLTSPDDLSSLLNKLSLAQKRSFVRDFTKLNRAKDEGKSMKLLTLRSENSNKLEIDILQDQSKKKA